MKIKLTTIYKATWEIVTPRICHHLVVKGFNSHIAIIYLSTYSWHLWAHPESFTPVAEGKCKTLKDGKRQIEEALKEQGML